MIAPSFADIFFNNCFKNGVLPLILPEEQVAALMDQADQGANAVVAIDLESQQVSAPDGTQFRFDIDPHRKRCLLNGLDDVGLTMEKAGNIDSFETKHRAEQPWLFA